MSEEEKKPSEEQEDQQEAPAKEAKPEDAAEEKPKKKATRKKTAKKKTTKKKAKKTEVAAAGDFLLVELTGKAVETGEVFDTTDEELAREEGIYTEDRVYGPRLVVVGEGWVLKGLDDRLTGLELSGEAEVEIPPEDAFGVRSSENVRMVPFRLLRSKGVSPEIGKQLEIDGRTAVVRSVGAGRVQLDFNHPLAGRKIVYAVKATTRYDGDEEKIRALIGRRFIGIDTEKFKLKKLKKKVRIEIPDEIFFGENIQVAKRGVALDIQRYFEDVEEVEYTEVIKRAPSPT
ncbi:MAG: FKBP-type peptidyl-prolyl cis-trans isomerase [Candidatus Bathyarchaeota archaeon]|nr:MAG: FKBP-type peptidyl-prolyl cis-trans isomerase [Candidatus Bathyarchaeota archaeon]